MAKTVGLADVGLTLKSALVGCSYHPQKQHLSAKKGIKLDHSCTSAGVGCKLYLLGKICALDKSKKKCHM